MSEPKPPPPVDPKREGGLKTPAPPTAEPRESGMIDEAEGVPPQRNDRPGGMIGEG